MLSDGTDVTRAQRYFLAITGRIGYLGSFLLQHSSRLF